VYIILTLSIGFAAVNTGNNLLFLIVSALLAFMAVSGVFGWINIRNIDLYFELPEEIYDGLETLLSIRLVNRKKLMPSFLLRVRAPGGDSHFTLVGRSGRENGSVVCVFNGRGAGPVGEICMESSFPINFFVRYRKYEFPEIIVVFPAPRACPTPVDIGEVGKRGEAAVRNLGTDGDLLRIRDYTGCEPLKLVHWRISAKHESLKVREMAACSGMPMVIDIDEIPSPDLERTLSCCAFLVNRLIRENRPVGLKAGSLFILPDLSGVHRLKLLSQLAVYGKN
jgi:uncharacterized protein (DUF58 family)